MFEGILYCSITLILKPQFVFFHLAKPPEYDVFLVTLIKMQ